MHTAVRFSALHLWEAQALPFTSGFAAEGVSSLLTAQPLLPHSAVMECDLLIPSEGLSTDPLSCLEPLRMIPNYT